MYSYLRIFKQLDVKTNLIVLFDYTQNKVIMEISKYVLTEVYMKKPVILLLFFSTLLMFYQISNFADSSTLNGGELLYKYQFISGDNGNLMLEKPLTRAEVAVIIAEIKGVKLDAQNFSLPPDFTDVSPDKWYAPYVSYGKAFNYLGGYPDGSFHPDSSVTAQEFAAFLMNALGYNGDYMYSNVLDFAKSKNITVTYQGDRFIRKDAFNALWEAVNQPIKGSDIPIGVSLGKLTLLDNTQKTDNIFSYEASSTKSFDIQFKNPVSDINRVTFNVTKGDYKIALNATWNNQKNVAKLSSNVYLNSGLYKIDIMDSNSNTPEYYGPFYIQVDKERVADIQINADILSKYDDHFGTVSFSAYNQYGENITNSGLAQSLIFRTTTSVSTPTVDFSTGLITVQHGLSGQSSATLDDLPNVTIIISDQASSLTYSKTLKISSSNIGINDIRINGIVDEDGNFIDFIYDLSKNYYLDLSIIDNSGQLVKSKNALVNNSGQEVLIVRSSNESLVTIQKISHPQRLSEIAFKINFNSAPTIDTPIVFTAIAPTSTGMNNSAIFTTILQLQ